MALMTQVGLEFIARNRANQQIGTFTRSVKNLGRQMLYMAGIGGGLYAFKRGFTAVISEASRAEEIRNKFNVVFKQLSGDAAKWAESFGNSVGRATQDVQEWMAGLQDTFVPLGIARDRAFELSKSLTQLAVDVASFNNKADADVIRDFTSALVGNHETVRKYGIIISETAIKQEALNRGMNKTYKELTDLEKVQLRYALIQKGTTDAQGDALRTANSYANQVKRLQGNIKELKAAIGAELLPVMNDLVQQTNALVSEDLAKDFAEFVRYQVEGFMAIYEAVGWAEEHIKALGKAIKELPETDVTKRAQKVLNQPGAIERFQFQQQEDAQRLIRATEEFAQHQRRITEERIKQEEELTRPLTWEEQIQAYETQLGFLEDIEKSENARLKKTEQFREKQIQEVTIIKDRWNEMSYSIESSFSNSIERMIFEGEKFRDVMKSIFREIAMAAIRALFIQPAAEATTGLIKSIGLSALSSAGITGSLSQEGAYTLAGMPAAQIGGFVERGGLARIHTGENIIPAGAGMNPPTVIINNNTGVKLRQQGPPQLDNKQWIVNVEAAMSESYDSGGVLRNIVEGRQG